MNTYYEEVGAIICQYCEEVCDVYECDYLKKTEKGIVRWIKRLLKRRA